MICNRCKREEATAHAECPLGCGWRRDLCENCEEVGIPGRFIARATVKALGGHMNVHSAKRIRRPRPRFFMRIIAEELPAWSALGWKDDGTGHHSPSVGPVLLLEWRGRGAPKTPTPTEIR
jgi:hypothetical protein